jgi:ATP-binding protein involved in chromosome partitioning
MMDPRLAVIEERLERVGRIVAVTGGKGGIGKSVVSSTLALTLGESARAGLLDLDLTSPCDHLILGVDGQFPEEKAGIVPPVVHGVHFMSVSYFSGSHPAPLRGQDFSSALIELLAITQWGELDVLVVDMPPGIADAALDAVRLLRRAEHLVVATGSRIVVETVQRTLVLMKQIDAQVIGLIENMQRGEGDLVRVLAQDNGVPYLGAVPFDPAVEDATGDPDRLAATEVARTLRGLSQRFL